MPARLRRTRPGHPHRTASSSPPPRWTAPLRLSIAVRQGNPSPHWSSSTTTPTPDLRPPSTSSSSSSPSTASSLSSAPSNAAPHPTAPVSPSLSSLLSLTASCPRPSARPTRRYPPRPRAHRVLARPPTTAAFLRLPDLPAAPPPPLARLPPSSSAAGRHSTGLAAAPVVARRRCPSAPLGPRLVGCR
nr:putative protein TPRXL [Aegilops tauschii subsp. strangulata]